MGGSKRGGGGGRIFFRRLGKIRSRLGSLLGLLHPLFVPVGFLLKNIVAKSEGEGGDLSMSLQFGILRLMIFQLYFLCKVFLRIFIFHFVGKIRNVSLRNVLGCLIL